MKNYSINKLVEIAQAFDQRAQHSEREKYPAYRRMAFLARAWAQNKEGNDSNS